MEFTLEQSAIITNPFGRTFQGITLRIRKLELDEFT
jgi:hypothetical protein